MKRKYMIAAILMAMLALAGVVWSQAGPQTYFMRVSQSGATSCSGVALLSPPLYKCSNMQLLDSSGEQVGTADWGYNNGVLVLSIDEGGDVSNYSIPATQILTGGTAAYPSCSAEWTIMANSGDAPHVVIKLGEYRAGGERAPQGCRASWQVGTVSR